MRQAEGGVSADLAANPSGAGVDRQPIPDWPRPHFRHQNLTNCRLFFQNIFLVVKYSVGFVIFILWRLQPDGASPLGAVFSQPAANLIMADINIVTQISIFKPSQLENKFKLPTNNSVDSTKTPPVRHRPWPLS